MSKEIYNIINDTAEVLNVSQMQKLQDFSTFFSWLGEKVEVLRDNCNNLCDRAMIDFLLSLNVNVLFMETKNEKHPLMPRRRKRYTLISSEEPWSTKTM